MMPSDIKMPATAKIFEKKLIDRTTSGVCSIPAIPVIMRQEICRLDLLYLGEVVYLLTARLLVPRRSTHGAAGTA